MVAMDPRESLREFYRVRARQERDAARLRRERFEARLPDIVAGILERDPDVIQIILFGSLAEKADGPVRDIDIALRTAQFLKVSAWLLSLPEPVDVVDINDLLPHIRARVEEKGRVLYERD